jgi:phosphoenolpyruvate-protein phosphotransferase/dihydroxyacetone kinase phosphotransfer subunit
MIGVVIVSHSALLAEGVVELARQVARDKVCVAAAGGTADAANPIGTDAFRVLAAIQAVDSGDGVLVLMDLGSAVLSAETALEFLDQPRRSRVRLCAGPLVEGAIAAVSLAAAGGTLAEIAAEAEQALSAKIVGQSFSLPSPVAERQVILPNRLGLHARPAARMIRLSRRFDARVTLENLTAHTGPFDAFSLNGMLSLGARQGHQVLLRAQGAQAREAIAELAAYLESGCGDTAGAADATPQPSPVDTITADEIGGIGASAGVAIGPLVRFRTIVTEVPERLAGDPDTEWRRLQSALAAARDETRVLYDWARRHTSENEAGIFDAQALLLEDPELLEQARRLIFEDGRDSTSAWHSAAGTLTERLAALEDPYLRGRAADLSDVAARVLANLTGSSGAIISLSQPSIVAARDLMPSQVEKLDPALVLGLCLETGSASAHSSILARARGIPAVVGLGPALSTLAEGNLVAIDGDQGKLWVSPGEDERRLLEERRRTWLASRQTSLAARHAPAVTRDGRRINVLANLNREEQSSEALDYGAEGVGVLRTEFLFLDRKTAPDESEQFACYRNIAAVLAGRPLVIRTLDIGGDKNVPYVDIGLESNPFLGWRGIRLTLGRRDLFETQLRAILRAGCSRPVEILLPMISTLEELLEAKAVIRGVEDALQREGVPFQPHLPLGVMIEVPAAAVIADQLAAEVTRLSIGTNDLVQYLMAADRTNSRVAGTADYFQPAVLRVIQDVVKVGRRAGIRVDVCGEMAADPLATPLLLGLGVEELSMSPPLIPEMKRAIARWTLPEAEALAHRALQAKSSEAVRHLLTR